MYASFLARQPGAGVRPVIPFSRRPVHGAVPELLERSYGIRPTGIVHVGANTGQEVPDYRASGIRPVVLVEPLAGPFGQLVRAVDGTPGFHPLKACLSDVAGRTVDFHVASNGGQSSSYLKPAAHLKIRPDITFDRTETMVTDTLDRAIGALCREHGLRPESFDYIGLDTQGSEMDILRRGSRGAGAAKYVFTEVNFGNLYEADTGVVPGDRHHARLGLRPLPPAHEDPRLGRCALHAPRRARAGP